MKRLSIVVAGVALAAAVTGCGGRTVALPATTPSPSPGLSGHLYENANVGYRVLLPEGWRRSARLSWYDPSHSRFMPGSEDYPIAYDVFTIRSADEEDRLIDGQRYEIVAPFMQYTATIDTRENLRRLDAASWVRAVYRASNLPGMDHVNLGATPAIRARPGPDGRQVMTYYVAKDDRIFVIGYYTLEVPSRPDWIPAGATEGALRAIVDSFRLRP